MLPPKGEHAAEVTFAYDQPPPNSFRIQRKGMTLLR